VRPRPIARTNPHTSMARPGCIRRVPRRVARGIRGTICVSGPGACGTTVAKEPAQSLSTILREGLHLLAALTSVERHRLGVSASGGAAQPPRIVEKFARERPQIWEAYNRLGEASTEAGPLDAKTQRLVKIALSVGSGLEGTVHSHVRRGLGAGLTKEEIEHVALLAITTIGWPSAIAALSWIEEETQPGK
jgi:alkylhydroperoxidase/carboxymuconolactone decarboxylase family protein YurZ